MVTTCLVVSVQREGTTRRKKRNRLNIQGPPDPGFQIRSLSLMSNLESTRKDPKVGKNDLLPRHTDRHPTLVFTVHSEGLTPSILDRLQEEVRKEGTVLLMSTVH